MSQTPAAPGPGPARQELLDTIGSWVLSVLRTEPGWDRVVVDLKHQGGRVHLRVREHRGGQVVPGTAGPIRQDSAVLPAIEQLRRQCYVPGRGSWFTATVSIAAQGHRVEGTFDYDREPRRWGAEEPLTGQDVLEHLERFPRSRARTPAWARELAERDGVELPAPAAEEAGSDREGVVHPLARAAIDRFVEAPENRTMIEVIRQCTAGSLLLDVTGSTLVTGPGGEAVGPDSTLRVQTLGEPDGTRSLAAYTSAAQAQALFDRHHPDGGRPVLLRRPAVQVLGMVAGDPQYHHLVLDPALRGCRIGRPQIEWAVRAPRNDAVKAAILGNDMSRLLAGLLAPDAVLLLGVRVQDGRAAPVYARPREEGAAPDTLLLFTSAPEVAVLDPALEVRSAPAREALRFALDAGAAKVGINAHAPVATLTAAQVRELLALVEQAQGREDPAGGDDPAAGTRTD